MGRYTKLDGAIPRLADRDIEAGVRSRIVKAALGCALADMEWVVSHGDPSLGAEAVVLARVCLVRLRRLVEVVS